MEQQRQLFALTPEHKLSLLADQNNRGYTPYKVSPAFPTRHQPLG